MSILPVFGRSGVGLDSGSVDPEGLRSIVHFTMRKPCVLSVTRIPEMLQTIIMLQQDM